MTMPGIPCIYYGSEWGLEGVKTPGTDASLRPEVKTPEFNKLTQFISNLCKFRIETPILAYGNFQNIHITNHQYVYLREYNNEKIIVSINASNNEYSFENSLNLSGIDIVTNKNVTIGNHYTLPPQSIQIVLCKS